MYDNSVIVFTTDNGGPAAGFDLNMASNYPLRGVKATLWEGNDVSTIKIQTSRVTCAEYKSSHGNLLEIVVNRPNNHTKQQVTDLKNKYHGDFIVVISKIQKTFSTKMNFNKAFYFCNITVSVHRNCLRLSLIIGRLSLNGLQLENS